MTRPEVIREPPLALLVARAQALVVPGERRILGLVGAPGAGKSTLAAALVAALGAEIAALVPMDGFHLPNAVLDRLGLRDRKGAPETFDAEGFVTLLRRLRSAGDDVVRAPVFDRTLDASVPDAIEVARGVPLVVTEGNYLLLSTGPWAAVRPILDEAWFLRADATRVDRLIARHVAHGRSPAAAREWVLRSDEANTRLVAASEDQADLVIDGMPLPGPA